MRVFFPQQIQQRFMNEIFAKVSLEEAAILCGVSQRTIRDWRRGKFSIDLKSLQILSRKTGLRIPDRIELRERYWYTAKGASKGGRAVFEKYGRIGGNPLHRKKKWYEWWEREGKHRAFSITSPKKIRKPPYSEKLAEFTGIEIGDGGLSKSQLTVTLHYKDDREYSRYVARLVESLFAVKPSMYVDKKYSVVDIVVSRTELVKFCNEKLGLKIGNKVKQNVDIPEWVKRKRNFAIACLRGLVDTDGSVFIHRYKVGKKFYQYKKLSFTSHSQSLLLSVHKFLRDIGLNPRLTSGIDVRLESKSDMKRYFEIVGTNNPKHWRRFTT